MKKNISRVLAVMLAVIMAVSLTPVAFAAPAEPEGWLEVPSLKDTYAKYFDIGNIISPQFLENGRSGVSAEEISDMLKYHYNVITGENEMKPSSLSSAKGVYNFANADKMVNWALDNGLAVHGHTLLWHAQSPNWLYRNSNNQPLTRAEAQANLKDYIDTVAGHFAGKVVSWDVVNEIFAGGSGWNATLGWQNSLRKSSPWYLAYENGMDAEAGETVGDFVYDAFVFARLADPNAVLYANDYNEHLSPNRIAIPAMAAELNAKWKEDPRNTDLDRPLVEGVGMQAHYWSHESNSLLNNVKIALDNFTAAGLRILVTELDIPAARPGTYSAAEATEADIINQTRMYGDLFALFQKYDAIERVTFWGLKDDWSWRGGTNGNASPLFFSPDRKAKAAYYAIIDAYVAPPLKASALKLDSDKVFVGAEEYFNLTASLDPNAPSNAASLSFTYDTDIFEYRGFTPADSITLFNTANDGNGKITFTLGNTDSYDLSDIGTFLFSAVKDIDIEQDSVINAEIDYVALNEGEKSILSAAASIEVGTRIIKEFSLIDLSDIIDLFGTTKSDSNWNIAKRFDFNNNGVIDINDISHVASLIK